MKTTEAAFHRSVVALLHSHGWFFWHTPNGELRHKKVAAKLTGMGVRRGVSDILILEPWICDHRETTSGVCDFCGKPATYGLHIGTAIALELKIWPNKLTPDQKQFLADVRARGWIGVVAHTMDKVIAVCRTVRPLNGRRML